MYVYVYIYTFFIIWKYASITLHCMAAMPARLLECNLM